MKRFYFQVLSLAAILFPRSATQDKESSSANHPGNGKDHLYV
jgi:hypothetical protein